MLNTRYFNLFLIIAARWGGALMFWKEGNFGFTLVSLFCSSCFLSCNPNIINLFGEKCLLRFIRCSQALFLDKWSAFNEEMAQFWPLVCWGCTRVGKYGMIWLTNVIFCIVLDIHCSTSTCTLQYIHPLLMMLLLRLASFMFIAFVELSFSHPIKI